MSDEQAQPVQALEETDEPKVEGVAERAVGPLELDGLEREVSARWVTGERVQGVIWGIVIGTGLTIGCGALVRSGVMPAWLNWLAWVVLLGMFAILAYFAWRYPVLAHRRLRYAVNERGIEIRKGVWWRSVVSVSKHRVQHTDVEQGPLMRKLGIAKLVIHTAGTQHAKVELPGLEQELATQVRDHLIGRSVGGRGGSSDG
jgi:hypothetical protein